MRKNFSTLANDNITQDNLTETVTETGTVTTSKQSQCSVSEERALMGAPPPHTGEKKERRRFASLHEGVGGLLSNSYL